MSLEDLYREVILDHYRNPRNREPLPRTDATAEGVNPLCGDEVEISLAFDEDTVVGISVRGQGCSISQSSASMMSAAVKGKSREEIADLIHRFKAMMDIEHDDGVVDPDQPGAVLGDLEALQGVRQYPVRIKCANLAWTTLEEALDGEADD
jgi:nitrogen fixation NifU-like protein